MNVEKQHSFTVILRRRNKMVSIVEYITPFLLGGVTYQMMKWWVYPYCTGNWWMLAFVIWAIVVIVLAVYVCRALTKLIDICFKKKFCSMMKEYDIPTLEEQGVFSSDSSHTV